jgi:YidC/Oxa1 family membrane protein insertase
MSNITGIFITFLIQLYSVIGDLGWTIIAFTLIMRSLLLPLTLPSIKAQKQMKKLQPELAELKKKHKGDKPAFQAAQMELYKKYNVNPLAGCLPQLAQIGVLILLYHALTSFLSQTVINGVEVNPNFLWLNLGLPDPKFIIPVLAAGTQLILSLMIAPGAEVKDVVPNQSSKKKVQVENKKEEDVAEMAATMQQQMLFIMPLMTGFFAARFPSGLGLYWVATTVFSIVQQYFLSGPGGLVTYVARFKQRFVK